MRVVQDHRGTASSLVGVVAIMLAFTVFALVYDVTYLYTKHQSLKNKLDFSNTAVFREIDQAALRNGALRINVMDGEDTFREFLTSNLRLDYNLHPLPGSMAAGPVSIQAMQIFNPEDLPALDGLGHPITEVSVYSEISVPVQPFFVGLFGPVNLRVAITTDAPAALLRRVGP